MNLTVILKALAESFGKEIVICDMNHTILYMNYIAKQNYSQRFGDDLVGKNLLDCHNEHSCKIIEESIKKAVAENLDSIQVTDKPHKHKKSYITMLRDANGEYIGYYERYEGDAF